MVYVFPALLGLSCAASVAACLWLLVSVGSRTGGRLLPVQLVNLALADALFSIGFAWITFEGLAGRSVNTLMWNVVHYALAESLLMQVCIALGFFALFWRLPRVMGVLQRTPYLTWLVSLLCTASYLEMFTFRGFSMCLEFRSTLGVPFCVVSVLYVMAWLRSWSYPLPQEVRAHRMVWLFPLTFVISFGPWIFVCETRFPHPSTFAALNGVLNVLAYRCNSRFLGTTWPEMTDVPLTQWLEPSSRPVTFRCRFCEVVTVLAEQRDALRESERQIAQLEEEHAAGDLD